MDLVETCGHYVLQADLPGLAGEDLTIQLEDNVLTISGEREAEHAQHQEGYDRLERALGGFSPLPHAPGRIGPRKAWRPTSIEACWRSEFASLSRTGDGRSRSGPLPAPAAAIRSRAPSPQTRAPTAATRPVGWPDPTAVTESSSEAQGAADRSQPALAPVRDPAGGRPPHGRTQRLMQIHWRTCRRRKSERERAWLIWCPERKSGAAPVRLRHRRGMRASRRWMAT